MTLAEQKKIIAEYMGITVQYLYPPNKYASEGEQDQYYHFDYGRHGSPDKQRFHLERSVKYDSSWDWLMPVLNKLYKENPTLFEEDMIFKIGDITKIFWAVCITICELNKINYE